MAVGSGIIFLANLPSWGSFNCNLWYAGCIYLAKGFVRHLSILGLATSKYVSCGSRVLTQNTGIKKAVNSKTMRSTA